MLKPDLTRRRMIAITAMAAGAAAFAGRRARAAEATRWHGSALGAQVSIEIHHPDRMEAARLIDRCLLETRRLEQQFSLYRADSAICVLNRTGLLVAPDPHMVRLLEESLSYARSTGGAFDPTVQPLWQLYTDHFASDRPDPRGPAPDRLEIALAKVGHRGLLVSTDRAALVKRGAAITLNGIAQGYITDRVVEMMRAAGLSSTLIDMGEVRAIGARPDGSPWRVGLDDADRPGALTQTIDLVDRAVATTAGSGFSFDASGRFTHLFDPVSGRSPALYRSLSVIAPTATEADALSTAFSLTPWSRVKDIVALRSDLEVRAIAADGALLRHGV